MGGYWGATMPETEVILVSEPPEFEIADDRLQFTLTSGGRKRMFSITRHKARNAIHEALRVLDEDAEQVRVSPFCKPCVRGLDD